MKILALSTSPRKGGNTDLLLDELLSDFHYYDSRVKQINKEIAEHLDKGKLAPKQVYLFSSKAIYFDKSTRNDRLSVLSCT